jgi:MFS family permease
MSDAHNEDYDDHDRGYDEDDYERPRRRRRREALPHSGLGIASFIIAIFSVLMIVTMFVIIIGLMGDRQQMPKPDRKDPNVAIVGMFGCGGCALSLIGAILGLVGLLLPDRKKVFAILGFIFNLLVVGFVVFLVIIGNIGKEQRMRGHVPYGTPVTMLHSSIRRNVASSTPQSFQTGSFLGKARQATWT